MKICSPQLGLNPNTYLGGEVYDYEIIKGLCKKGIKVDVLLPKNRKYEKHSNLKIIFLPITHIIPPHIFNILALPYMLIMSKKNSYDILRLHNPYFLGIGGWIVKKIYPNKKIVTDVLLAEERLDLKIILKRTIHIYDHIFVLTNYLRKWLEKEYGFDHKKITVIYGGVSKDLYPANKDKDLIKKYKLESKTVLLNIGLMSERKNVTFLVKLFMKLSVKYKNLVLILCGNGQLKTQLKEYVKKYNLEHKIYILDPVHGVSKTKMFNLADIFMFPTKNEGFGLVAAEAMACAKPVIASDNTSLPEVVDNAINGFLAKTNDLNDWYQKTEKLILDRSLRNRMGLNARNKSEKIFSWESVNRRIVEGLKKTLS